MLLSLQPGGAAALLHASLPDGTAGLAWLGQAGFLIRYSSHIVLVDPYLSDHLARKYAGTEFPHTRMMPPPILAEEVHGLGLVLCSHRHGDHADPGSLPTLAANNPECRFVLPRAEAEAIAGLGLPAAQVIPANAGETVRLSEAVSVHVLPSAHESIRTNERGEHRFLGFIVELGEFTLYHPGDCVVYEGQAEQLRTRGVDLALLPVNGRNPLLTARGILGNMTFEEARNLCLAAGIGAMVPHHFGMFAFNTPTRDELERQAARPNLGLKCFLPSTDAFFLLSPPSSTSAHRLL